MTVYRDINGKLHIPLQNIYNCYCWFITAIQRLQCSETISQILLEYENKFHPENNLRNSLNNNDLTNFTVKLTKPILILNKLNEDNHSEIITELKTFFDENKNLFKANDGFSSNLYLSKYIFPIIFHFAKELGKDPTNILIKIMHEIGLNSSNIYISAETIPNEVIPVLRENPESEKSFMQNYYEEFKNIFGEYLQNNPFRCEKYASAELELWSYTDSGHVVPIINCKTNENNSEWIVFDDHRFTGKLLNYLVQPYNFYKLKFSLTDDSFKKYITENLSSVNGKNINKFKVSESLVYLILINEKNPNKIIKTPISIAGGNKSDGNETVDEDNNVNNSLLSKIFVRENYGKIFIFLTIICLAVIVILCIIIKFISRLRCNCLTEFIFGTV